MRIAPGYIGFKPDPGFSSHIFMFGLLSPSYMWILDLVL
jgi:hypothetical protein